jgi:hypothetical protein
MNFPPPPPDDYKSRNYDFDMYNDKYKPTKYKKIIYRNANYITDENKNEIFGNPDIFYYNGYEYVNLGRFRDIMKKGHADKVLINNETHDMRNYANDLYIKSGGYKKRKTFRSKSKTNLKPKRKNTKTQQGKTRKTKNKNTKNQK